MARRVLPRHARLSCHCRARRACDRGARGRHHRLQQQESLGPSPDDQPSHLRHDRESAARLLEDHLRERSRKRQHRTAS